MTKADAALQLFHPVVRHWFVGTFGRGTKLQSSPFALLRQQEETKNEKR